MTKFFQFIRKVAGLYNLEKLLMCGAQFARTHNTAGIDADTQAALRMKNKIFRVNCPIFVLNNDLDIAPHSMSENLNVNCQGDSMPLLVMLLLYLPSVVLADCYVIGELKGFSTRERDGYELSDDGISSQKFIIEINGDNSSVSPNNMNCFQAGSHTLLCLDKISEGQSTIETWNVYPDKRKAVYTKSINGYGSFNGGNLFVGEIKSQCN